ncbi:MAG: carbohydrate binding family 9 domain-containing protein [Ignavibacteriae bacterium]|nr:carbohydrate binding family 9 domain-containing protein [Ignavibacteriota bacterium]
MKRIVLAMFVFMLLGTNLLTAQESPNPLNYRVKATRINGNIELTGRLTDPHWSLAPEIPLPYEVDPGENIPAPQRTIVKVLYNKEFLYVGYICYDTDMTKLRANVTDRDKMFDDDFAFIMIDTFGDKQRAYEFVVNPVGVQGDLLRTSNNEDETWDAIWYSAAAISDSLWTVEMAIPFKSIRFPAKQMQDWLFMAGRIYPRTSRAFLSWTPFDRNDPCFTCKSGMLEGIEDVESTSAFEALPYVVGLQSGALNNRQDPTSSFTNGDLRGRFGLGVKYFPNPGFVLDAVVNPDFSQVESDASQISVNSTFALFYPERRPFFLEGIDLFDTRISGFYSRMINNPVVAAKVTEKSGALAFGLLTAADRSSTFIIPGEEGSSFVNSDLDSYSTVARARYDLGNQSFIGGLGTARNTGSAYNYVGGVDWTYFFWEHYYFRGQALLSTTKEVNDPTLFNNGRTFRNTDYNAAFNGETYTGSAIDIGLNYNSRDFNYGINYNEYTPTFHAYNGFVTSNDTRFITANSNYNYYPNGAVVDNGYVFFNGGLHFNHWGHRKERWIVLGTGMQMKAQTFWEIGGLALNEELFRGVYFPNVPRAFWYVQTRASGSLNVTFRGDIGEFIYRSDTPEVGAGHNMTLSATIKPTGRFQLNLNYSRSELTSKATDQLLFDGYIARAVGIYQFSPEFFVRLIGEYNQFGKTFQFYPLVSYKLNPFTIFYAGSTHNLYDFENPHGVTQTERQFFVKLQYLWRS